VTQSNVASGTVRHEALSADNADSTLRIVKERQPILSNRWRKQPGGDLRQRRKTYVW